MSRQSPWRSRLAEMMRAEIAPHYITVFSLVGRLTPWLVAVTVAHLLLEKSAASVALEAALGFVLSVGFIVFVGYQGGTPGQGMWAAWWLTFIGVVINVLMGLVGFAANLRPADSDTRYLHQRRSNQCHAANSDGYCTRVRAGDTGRVLGAVRLRLLDRWTQGCRRVTLV